MADLEIYTHKVLSGMAPKDALRVLIKRAIHQIRMEGFGFSPGHYSKVSFYFIFNCDFTQKLLVVDCDRKT